MSGWVVVADLLSLRAEYDELAPARDRGADGTVGNRAHQLVPSDHNPDDTPGSKTPHTDADSIAEVHALDIDATGPWPPGMTMAASVGVVLARMRTMGTRAPLAYVIWDRHIYQYPTFGKAAYGGDDPHTGHVHFSSRYGSGSGSSNPENYEGPWGLLEAFDVTKDDVRDALIEVLQSSAGRHLVAAALLAEPIGDLANPRRTVGDVLRDAAKLRGVLVGDQADTANAALKSTSPLAQLLGVPAAVGDLAEDVALIEAHIAPEVPPGT